MDEGEWFVCCHGIRICRDEVSNFDTLLLGVYEVLKGKGQEVLMNDIAYVCWQIWKIRCEMVMERKMLAFMKLF